MLRPTSLTGLSWAILGRSRGRLGSLVEEGAGQPARGRSGKAHPGAREERAEDEGSEDERHEAGRSAFGLPSVEPGLLEGPLDPTELAPDPAPQLLEESGAPESLSEEPYPSSGGTHARLPPKGQRGIQPPLQVSALAGLSEAALEVSGQLGEELFLVPKVVMHEARRELGLLSHRLDGGAPYPRARHDPLQGFQDLAPSRRSVARAGHRETIRRSDPSGDQLFGWLTN